MRFGQHPFEEEDDRPRPKRWLGFIAFITLYLAVSGVLVAVLIRFTKNWILAVTLVGFMVAYMTVMAWMALRRSQDKDL